MEVTDNNGAPGATLTRDLPLRRRTLYTTELREHNGMTLADWRGCSPAGQCPYLRRQFCSPAILSGLDPSDQERPSSTGILSVRRRSALTPIPYASGLIFNQRAHIVTF